MKNFEIIEIDKFKDSSNYEMIEDGIYNDLNDDGGFATHRIAMTMVVEEGENSQYPLEDVLDKFYVHVEEFLEPKNENETRFIFGGELDDIQNLKSLIGKRAFNQDYVDEEGQTRVKLIIE
ncbi:MAG: hypothetical protein NXI09_09690 [Bacteroidetes bacterium]|nr:hypothetical protein [Bacteroidota bacterium]